MKDHPVTWSSRLPYDAVSPLLASGNVAVKYWARRDLLGEKVPPAKDVLWGLKIPQHILNTQCSDGSWEYPTKVSSGAIDYSQLETYRQLGFLVEMFGFDKTHKVVESAAGYILAKQSTEGDIKGIYANQYTPNYTAAMIELLVKAGYGDDARIYKAFDWPESMRQNDGGWALAFRTRGSDLRAIYAGHRRMMPDTSKPFSHFVTGVVLRAYAAHPQYRGSDTAAKAAELLAGRLFERDVYADRNGKKYWSEFSFPFWQTDMLTALDVIGLIKPSLTKHQKVIQAAQWFIDRQQPSGLFAGHLLKDRYHDLPLWYTYAICRALMRLQ